MELTYFGGKNTETILLQPGILQAITLVDLDSKIFMRDDVDIVTLAGGVTKYWMSVYIYPTCSSANNVASYKINEAASVPGLLAGACYRDEFYLYYSVLVELKQRISNISAILPHPFGI